MLAEEERLGALWAKLQLEMTQVASGPSGEAAREAYRRSVKEFNAVLGAHLDRIERTGSACARH